MHIEITEKEYGHLLKVAESFDIPDVKGLITSLASGVLEIQYSAGTITWLLKQAVKGVKND